MSDSTASLQTHWPGFRRLSLQSSAAFFQWVWSWQRCCAAVTLAAAPCQSHQMPRGWSSSYSSAWNFPPEFLCLMSFCAPEETRLLPSCISCFVYKSYWAGKHKHAIGLLWCFLYKINQWTFVLNEFTIKNKIHPEHDAFFTKIRRIRSTVKESYSTLWMWLCLATVMCSSLN